MLPVLLATMIDYAPIVGANVVTKLNDKAIKARREYDMVVNTNPIIPVPVEALLARIDSKLDILSGEITKIRDTLHAKADKTEFNVLEAKFIDLVRNGSDVAKRAELLEMSLSAKVDKINETLCDRMNTMDKKMASQEAVEDTKRSLDANSQRIEKQERSQLFQWITILINTAGVVGGLVLVFQQVIHK